jgi:hypothetical protein
LRLCGEVFRLKSQGFAAKTVEGNAKAKGCDGRFVCYGTDLYSSASDGAGRLASFAYVDADLIGNESGELFSLRFADSG